MRLSRVNKFKKKDSSLLTKLTSDRKVLLKKFILTTTITGAALFSTTMAFADGGLTEYLKRWYSERLIEVEENLTSSIEAEATNQKALLLKDVREQTELSIQEIQEYAASKQTTIMSNIENKAKETKDAISTDIQADLELTKKLIDEQTTVVPPTGDVSDTTEDNSNLPIEENDETSSQPNNDKDKSNPEKEKEKSNPIVIDPIENSK